jgi:hypothetical protein
LELIERRLDHRRPTVLTTNCSLQEIGRELDGRIASRLRGFHWIELTGPDRRQFPVVRKECVVVITEAMRAHHRRQAAEFSAGQETARNRPILDVPVLAVQGNSDEVQAEWVNR